MRSIHRPAGRLRFSDGSAKTWRRRLQQLGARAFTTLYRRMLFMSYPLAGREIPSYRSRVQARFDTLERGGLEAYSRFRPGASRIEIERRLARGDRCFIAWHGGEIIDACWTATGSVFVPYLRRFLVIPHGDIYSYDSFTARDFRGAGLYMARNSFTARQNQAEGFRRSIALVAAENYAAWMILTRSGLKTLGAYHYIRGPGVGIRWQTTEPDEKLPPLLSRLEDAMPVSWSERAVDT